MSIVILGSFFADCSFRAARQPRTGETIHGEGFALGPGGKGSNQAVAAARAGGRVRLLTRVGKDPFADMARALWAGAGVEADAPEDEEAPTGAACILIEAGSGDNAIIIAPGAVGRISVADIEARAGAIGGARVFLTQLEQPLAPAERALAIARAGGAATILNPAPAAPLSDAMLALCDFVTPNETEAETLTGIAVDGPEAAEAAARALMARGAGAVVLTMGEKGALFHEGRTSLRVPALHAGPVVETTGAGDAFNGGFATALAEGRQADQALRFAAATAALSVTRPGAAASMPDRAEIDALLARGPG